MNARSVAEFYRGRRVLVTGGLGFIGSNLSIELHRLGADVTVVDSMLPAYGAKLENVASIRNGIRINFSDVRDRHSLAYLVRDQEVIFSLAGQVSHINSMTKPLVDLDINCRSQLSLLECCRRSNPSARLVLSGTRQVYGKPRSLPVREDHPIAPA
ncbi:MAG: GDP-mannose 4,6-dehydratase, partial [Pirellula sp.]